MFVLCGDRTRDLLRNRQVIINALHQIVSQIIMYVYLPTEIYDFASKG
jgi:hypothetical protein